MTLTAFTRSNVLLWCLRFSICLKIYTFANVLLYQGFALVSFCRWSWRGFF